MRIPVLSTLYRAGLAWNSHNASFLGAALAYYTLFSIAPLLIIAIAMVGIVYGRDAVEQKVVAQLRDYVGVDAAKMVQDLIQNAWNQETSLLATVVGGGLLLLAAANLFRQLRIALDMLWSLPPLPHRNVVISTVISYLLGVLMVLVAACFWLALMAGDAALTIYIRQAGDLLPGGEFHWKIGQYSLLFALLTTFIMLTFRFLSLGRIHYRHLWFGAMAGAGLFLLGRLAFGYYLAAMGEQLATAFGAASSLVIFLVWVYYSAQIVFYAAEIVKVKKEDADSAAASKPAGVHAGLGP